jgi:predicted AAA+ superfamily ATPase
MLQISLEDVKRRLDFDNPWWSAKVEEIPYADLPERDYFPLFCRLVANRAVKRAIILMGPRRVGKTVMLYQMVKHLIQKGENPNTILYLSLETPIYTGFGLEKFLQLFQERFKHLKGTPLTIFFDEIQYLAGWEVHLKSLVDTFPAVRFVASGSAAAALRLKSRESGAGRFTDFLLPPLTFSEYLRFVGRENELVQKDGANSSAPGMYATTNIEELNKEFITYLNFGGYPEAVFNEHIRNESAQFIKSDIIDKVLLRDLPQIYGIRDIQELNRLFTTLAYNTGNEVSLEGLSQASGVSKTTLNRYLEYLEAAFLLRRVYRIDQNAKRFQRATSYKVYLTNPTMRAALFGTQGLDDIAMGALAETALFSQWFHNSSFVDNIYYARWAGGEIDLVALNPKDQKPTWCVEVKWSDRSEKDYKLLRHLTAFRKKHPSVDACTVTTRTVSQVCDVHGYPVHFRPTSLQVYAVGRNVVRHRTNEEVLGGVEAEEPVTADPVITKPV